MNFWRNLILLLLCLTILTASSVHGEETGFRKYRENVLQRIEKMKTELAKDPLDAEKHFQLGLAYMALGRHDEEVTEYLEAVRLTPDYAEAHFNLGLSYDLLEDGTRAIEHMLRARQIYSVNKNHRGVRASQRYLRTFYGRYGSQGEGSDSAHRE